MVECERGRKIWRKYEYKNAGIFKCYEDTVNHVNGFIVQNKYCTYSQLLLFQTKDLNRSSDLYATFYKLFSVNMIMTNLIIQKMDIFREMI